MEQVTTFEPSERGFPLLVAQAFHADLIQAINAEVWLGLLDPEFDGHFEHHLAAAFAIGQVTAEGLALLEHRLNVSSLPNKPIDADVCALRAGQDDRQKAARARMYPGLDPLGMHDSPPSQG